LKQSIKWPHLVVPNFRRRRTIKSQGPSSAAKRWVVRHTGRAEITSRNHTSVSITAADD
jgi:hypothetical protein